MSAGTISLTNNSDVVTGTGTAFSTDLVAGDFVAAKVGGITYTLPVKSIESPTSLTLIRVFPGPTQSGAAWNAIPRDTLNQVTSELVAQTTEALRGLNYDKQNWQAVFSVNGNITVKLPDGSSFSGPSWVKIVELLNSIDPDAIQALADQIHTDALQVAADRSDVDSKATQVSANAAQVALAKIAAQEGALTATTKAGEATSSAASAKNDADRAQGANPDNQLKKAQNLADLPDKSLARDNLGLDSKAYIRGLDLSVSATSVSVSAGAAAIPSTGEIIAVSSSGLTATISSTSPGTWYHIYLLNNSGRPDLEISAAAPVAYAYPAHQKTGDATRRYLGSFRVDATNAVRGLDAVDGVVILRGDWGANNRMLAGGTSTTLAVVNVGTVVPSTATSVSTTANNTATVGVSSISSTNDVSGYMTNCPAGGKYIFPTIPLRAYPNIYYWYITSASGGGLYIDVGGYKYAR